jgi:hypothetical protein
MPLLERDNQVLKPNSTKDYAQQELRCQLPVDRAVRPPTGELLMLLNFCTRRWKYHVCGSGMKGPLVYEIRRPSKKATLQITLTCSFHHFNPLYFTAPLILPAPHEVVSHVQRMQAHLVMCHYVTHYQ